MKASMKKTPTKTSSESRFWECADCGNKDELVIWSYEDMVEKGHPVCPSCSNDMRLVSNKKSATKSSLL